MKNRRQEIILELIERYEVQKQEDLIRLLEERGITATKEAALANCSIASWAFCCINRAFPRLYMASIDFGLMSNARRYSTSALTNMLSAYNLLPLRTKSLSVFWAYPPNARRNRHTREKIYLYLTFHITNETI